MEKYHRESDKSIRDSSIQGGKIIGEKLAEASVLIGVAFFIIGVFALVSIAVGLGYPLNTAAIIAALLATIIGLLLIIGGCSIQKAKRIQEKEETTL